MSRFRSQRGFTIVELVVAMTVFAVVITVAVGAFVNVQRTAQKTSAQRKVQQDTRYNLEQLTRQIRSARIDYGFYLNNQSNAQCNISGRQMLAMFVTDASSPAPKRTFYWYQATERTLYSLVRSDVSTIPTCSEVVNDTARTRQIGDGIALTDLQFFVLPTADPLDTAQTDLTIRNTHPRVTILWGAQTGTNTSITTQPGFDEVRLQTTVSTRAYPIEQTVGQ